VGITARTQTINHYRLFLNRFSAECRKDAAGVVNVVADSPDSVVRAMLFRELDILGRRYVFYGLDRPLTSAELNQISGDTGSYLLRVSPVVQIPLWVNGIGVSYNLGCTSEPLHLSSVALSKIFTGVVTRWNHDLITIDNPSLENCDQAIRVGVRSDPNEGTAAFKDYLSKRNTGWRTYLADGMNTRWPPSLFPSCRGRGDAGMAACIAGEPGSIGYVGFGTAFREGLQLAEVQNKTGFVAPSYDACTEAASNRAAGYPGRADLDWSPVSLTDGPIGYPVCHLEFGMAFEKMITAYQARVGKYQIQSVKDYLITALLASTQQRLPRYGAAPLPDWVRDLAQQGVELISYFE
jgi:phosphate transport system substrate-binding protein